MKRRTVLLDSEERKTGENRNPSRGDRSARRADILCIEEKREREREMNSVKSIRIQRKLGWNSCYGTSGEDGEES